MTDKRDWLESKGLTDIEECEATRDDDGHTMLQHKEVIEHGDCWLSYYGEAMTIKR